MVTQAFDVDKVLKDGYLLRFSNSLRFSEETEGMRWRFRPALYKTIDYRRAMRYEAFVRGETDVELVRNAEEHVNRDHPALVGKISREDLLAMAEEDESS